MAVMSLQLFIGCSDYVYAFSHILLETLGCILNWIKNIVLTSQSHSCGMI